MKFLVIFLSLVLIPFSHAATLEGTNGVELLAIDGQKIKTGMFQSGDLNVADGEHQVVVKYSKRVKDEMVYSKPYIFVVDIKGDTEITVKRFSGTSQAKHAVKKGLNWIVKNDLPTKKIKGEVIFKEGVQINPDIEKLVAEYNKAHGLGPVDEQQALLVCTPEQLLNQSKSQQLIELYHSATAEEKKAFRIWLVENDIK